MILERVKSNLFFSACLLSTSRIIIACLRNTAILAVLFGEQAIGTNPTPLPTPQAIWQAQTPVANPTYDSDLLPEGHAFKVQWGNSLPSGGYWLYRRLEPTQTWDLAGLGYYNGSGAYEYQENSFLSPGQYYYKVQQLGSALQRTDEGTPQPGWIGGMRIATRTPTSAPTPYGTAPPCGPYTPYRFVLNDSIMKPVDAEVGDIDGDGDYDLIFAKGVGNELVWYRNQSGSFSLSDRYLISAIHYTIPTANDSISSISPGDMDDDGDTDIVVAYEDDQTLVWYESDGASIPAFTLRTIAASESISSVSTVDINNDGYLDILTLGASGAAYFLNDGATDPTFSRYSISTDPLLKAVTAANVRGNNGGYVDIITAWANSGPLGTIEILENPETDIPMFPPGETVANNYDFRDPHIISCGDLDGDGDIDLIAGCSPWFATRLFWFENCECPSGFKQHLITDDSEVYHITELRAVDFDNDGDLDILSTGSTNSKIFLFENDGAEDPTFQKKTLFDGLVGVYKFDIEDLNSDGLPDIAYCTSGLLLREVGWIENTNDSPCPTAVPTTAPTPMNTPTPTNPPTPKAIWQLAPNSNYVSSSNDLDSSDSDYDVYFGGNIPNLPSRYVVERKSNPTPNATYQEIAPTLTYNDESNTFSFRETTPFDNSYYRIKVKNWDGSIGPDVFSEELNGSPDWHGGIVEQTVNPLPTPILLRIKGANGDYVQVQIDDASMAWPLTTAVPFPPNTLRRQDVGGLRVLDGDDAVVPSQFRVMEIWKDDQSGIDGDDYIRWLQVDLIAHTSLLSVNVEDSAREYSLVWSPNIPQPNAETPLRFY